jgi:hypothetical protein
MMRAAYHRPGTTEYRFRKSCMNMQQATLLFNGTRRETK